MRRFYIKQLFLTMAALLCSAIVSAYDFEVDGIYYNVTDEANSAVEVTFKGKEYSSYSNEYSGDVVIPASVSCNGKNYSVTSIGEYAFYCCYGLTSVTIPNSVTSIGDYVFYFCDDLTNVTIPNGVTSIGECAFMEVRLLTSVTIPNSVTTIGDYAFAYCNNLTTVINLSKLTISKGSTSNGCVGYNADKIINAHNGKIEGDWVFAKIDNYNTLCCYIGNATELSLPDSYKGGDYVIGNDAFYKCSGLTSVTIPNSVKSIGESAFEDCRSLTSVTIPNSVTSIGKSAFKRCRSLTSVTIPNSVTSIGESAFYDCRSLTSIVVESGNSVYDNRNNCNAIIETATNTLIQGCNNTTIPNGVTSIGNNAFYYCDGLTKVEIPNSVTSIGESAFYDCFDLASITIPTCVTTIGNNAFDGTAWYNDQPYGVVYAGKVLYRYKEYKSDRTSINIKEGTLGIAGGAFEDCGGLTSITIPNSVTTIGNNAFDGCCCLTSITIPNSVTSIGESVFCCCESLTSIVVEGGNKKYDSRNNCNAIIKTETNVLVAGCRNTTIPDGVATIGDNAFCSCSGLTSVTIPNSVTSIGDYAFYMCNSLTNVTIGNSVTSIGRSAFHSCSRLKSVYVKTPTPPSIDYNTFIKQQINYGYGYSDCTYIDTLYIPKGSRVTYEAAEGWKEFRNIKEFDVTAIENVEDVTPAFEITSSGIQFTAAEGKAIAIYAANGALVEKIDDYAGEEITLDKGVYIVRVGDKTMKIKL